MFRIIFYLVSFFLFWSSLLNAQVGTTHYQHDIDYSGIAGGVNYSGLYELAAEAADTLPQEYATDFVVVDGGQYHMNKFFVEEPVLRFDSKFEELRVGKKALLFIGRMINEKGEYSYYSRVHLEQSEDFSCLGPIAASSMQSYLNTVMNEKGALDIVVGQSAGLKKFIEEVDYLTSCCTQESENKSAINQCSACDVDNSLFADPFIEFENMILNHGDINSVGKFTYLGNTDFSFSSSEEQFRTVNLSGIDVVVPNLVASLKKPELVGSFNLFDDLERMKSEASSLGIGDKVRVSITYIDESNCNNLRSILNTDRVVNQSDVWSGGEGCSSPGQIGCNGGQCMVYDEQLIILYFDGEFKVYSKITSPWPEGNLVSQSATGQFGDSKSLIIPALIVREVLKRVAMGVINVFIDMGITIVIEKVFGIPSDCQSGEDLWSDAWARYKISEFSNTRYAVWKFILVFAEGAIGGNMVFDVISGGIQASLKYLITGNENFAGGGIGIGSMSINGPPGADKASSNFKLKVFFRKFAIGAATSAIGPTLKWSKNTAKEIMKNSDEVTETLVEGVSDEVIEDVINELKKDGGELFWELVKDPRLTKAWITSYLARDISEWGELVANKGWNHHLYVDVLETIEGQGNGPISFGFRELLLEFSIGTKSVSFPDFSRVFGTNVDVFNLSVFENVFREATSTCVNGGHKIHFKLDMIIDHPSNLSAINNGLVPLDDQNLTTLWEIGVIMRDIDLYSNTIFYKNGKVVELRDLLDVGIRPVN
jgi:hypothetical protein